MTVSCVPVSELLHDGQESHDVTSVDWNWNAGQTERSKWFNSCVIMMTESSQPKSDTESDLNLVWLFHYRLDCTSKVIFEGIFYQW